MDISVVIPCIFFHFKHIPDLLNLYTHQTLIPNEIIVSVTESDNILEDILKVENKTFPFNLKIIKNKGKIRAGLNRQIGSKLAKNKFIIYQDADDMPHNQRVEIMNYFFTKKNANHITHLVTSSPRELVKQPYTMETIKYIEWRKRENRPGFRGTTLGNIGIKKDILKDISWSEHFVGEDTRFTDKILEKYENCYRVSATLLYYRKHLSSYRTINKNSN